MDRRTVLERLDAVRPSSDDLALPEMAESRQALRDDPELADEFASRARFDGRIAAAMHDVVVPEGLRFRLLQRLEAEISAEAAPVVTVPKQTRRMTRRGAMAMVGALAASLVVGGLYWSGIMDSTTLVAVADVEEAAARFMTGSTELVPFEGPFQPRPPLKGRWSRLRFDPAVYGLLPSDQGHRAAAWRFSWNGAPGVLVAIPREFVAVPPDQTRDYVGGNTVAWTEGEFVYVCRVDGQIDDLLRQIDEGRLA